jgi:hypothetical protein
VSEWFWFVDLVGRRQAGVDHTNKSSELRCNRSCRVEKVQSSEASSQEFLFFEYFCRPAAGYRGSALAGRADVEFEGLVDQLPHPVAVL